MGLAPKIFVQGLLRPEQGLGKPGNKSISGAGCTIHSQPVDKLFKIRDKNCQPDSQTAPEQTQPARQTQTPDRQTDTSPRPRQTQTRPQPRPGPASDGPPGCFLLGEGKEGEGDQEAKGRNPGVHLAARRPAGAPRGLGPRVLGKYHYL